MQLVWVFHVENRGEKNLWASQHWNWSSGITNHQIQLFHFLIVWRLEIEWFGYGSLRHSNQFSFCPSVSPSSCLYLSDWQEMIYLCWFLVHELQILFMFNCRLTLFLFKIVILSELVYLLKHIYIERWDCWPFTI